MGRIFSIIKTDNILLWLVFIFRKKFCFGSDIYISFYLVLIRFGDKYFVTNSLHYDVHVNKLNTSQLVL